MYGLSAADLEIQGRAREFTDGLIQYEEQAEAARGRLPDAIESANLRRATELGLYATNLPPSVGGQGCTMLQQVLVQEQGGRVTNGIAWCLGTPTGWWPAVANDHQRERWLLPTARGEMVECYAITEELAGSDVSELRATARRDGEAYVLDGVKWHVTSFDSAAYVFFQAVLTTGEHAGQQALFVVDVDAPGVRVVRTPAYSHTLGHEHPIVAFEG
ncbi:MAG: acyl-CoA dehydrogenase, partial [Nocardioidaceae bacterium]|nr:acyl-CoA dehydrogenase [Nocardioidaceae bacterium]